MGMFDTVCIRCPGCYTELEFQSKAGTCELEIFDEQGVPTEIAHDLVGETLECHVCGKTWEVTLYNYKPTVPVFLKEIT